MDRQAQKIRPEFGPDLVEGRLLYIKEHDEEILSHLYTISTSNFFYCMRASYSSSVWGEGGAAISSCKDF